jgi:Amt family ammonium transporter
MSSAVRCLTASLCCAQANVLSTMAQSLVITCVVSVLWMALGYSLTFAEGNAFYGGASRFWLMNVFDNRVGTLPEVLFCMYQMTFAIICVAIITGSFAERMRFGPMIIFSGLWHLLVYCPIAHWEWGPGGFLHYAGVIGCVYVFLADAQS